tara:strand:- start:157 stop:396 length:240 start_codon:yes stop_codon:yes gene_type:complete
MALKKVLLEQKQVELLLEGLNKLSHSAYENKNLDQDDWNDLVDLQKLLHDIRKLPQHQTLGDVLEQQDAYWKALWKMRQ